MSYLQFCESLPSRNCEFVLAGRLLHKTIRPGLMDAFSNGYGTLRGAGRLCEFPSGGRASGVRSSAEQRE
jgi:hypothetical protein